MNFDYYQLQALNAVSKEGSFQRAADKLFMTQSAISQRIKALENIAGEPLLIRSTPPQLTRAGMNFISVFTQIDALMKSLKVMAPTERVRIPVAFNIESFHMWFSQCLVEFTKNTKVLFDLSLEDQEHTLNLLRETKVLACVSSEKAPAQGCRSDRIQDLVYVCVATKEFIKEYDLIIDKRSKILAAPTVVYGQHDRIHEKFLSELIGTKKTPPYIAHTIPSISGILDQVEHSTAYAVLPEKMVLEKLQSTKIIDLFPRSRLKVPMFWHSVQTEIPILKELTEVVLKLQGYKL